uniref:NADH-ubiquinone oxidoreductase chain 4 n=1 Tax=Pelecinus polyturator TaxID=44352 RepID=A0A0E3EKS6_9HYME|nr:NADH dehydrogenase subunit 4 [Pelecinus polyturator]AIW82473.1 NADH dehydrogenase subunit 4 [Pelecinus polyturator]
MMVVLMMIFMVMIFNLYLNSKIKVNLMILIYLSIMFYMIFESSYMMNFMSFNNLYMSYGLDKYSYGMILLSVWIMILMFMVKKKMNFMNLYLFLLNLLMLILFLFFYTLNYFMFYLFFEISLIPVMVLILGWGYQVERVQASMYMIMYTLFASLPFLIILFKLYNFYSSLELMFLMKMSFNSFIFYFFMIFLFLVKLPIFFFHLWLPKAHVEAPIMGSMVLAAILLKLGGYGMMRSLMMMVKLNFKYNIILMSLVLIGSFYLSLVCMRQVDMKMLVAYSSVVHMGMMLMSLLTMFYLGYEGGYLMMLSHGICSSGLFCLVNLMYERVKSRSIYIGKGLLMMMPSMSLFWFLLCMNNMGSPPSLNLLSEIFIYMSLINWDMNLMMMMFLISFTSSCYCLYMYTYSNHGGVNMINYSYLLNNINEFMYMFMHTVPLNIIILKIYLLI